MPTPGDKLAASLEALQALQKDGRRVFESKELTRVHRERLLRHGFVQEVVKGWIVSAGPGVQPGDSTPWYASFWEFCARYCRVRFGEKWHLSSEQSLLLHAETTVVPSQVVVYAANGGNHALALPFNTSLYDLKQTPASDIAVKDGLRLLTITAALLKVPDGFFVRHPIEAQLALANLHDESELLRRLLDGAHSAIAGRLAGAFRRTGKPATADEILKSMRSAGHDVREVDPFAPRLAFRPMRTSIAPIVGRIQAMWASMRSVVIEIFPKPPGLPAKKAPYLHAVEDIYKSDAYHSLSIEGYNVTPALIARVRTGVWDKHDRDALAARGYWQAFQAVQPAIAKILAGGNPGTVVRQAHREWYRQLFQPFAASGIIPASTLAGYRCDAVFLRASRYAPPRWEAVRDAMPAFFKLLEQEEASSVRAVLGHWLFGYIHPYPDGNGRMARFVRNAMLASGGYPWTVIRVEDRAPYLDALDRASIDADIAPFASFIAARVGN